MDELRVVLIGQHKYTPYLLRELQAHEAVSVVGHIIRDSTKKNSDYEYNHIDVYTGEISTPEAQSFLTNRDVDLGICLGWYDVIDEEVLSTPVHGIIGLHAAPLPKGRGHAPVNWQIIGQEETATISIFQFTDDIDAGEVYGKATVPIHDNETTPQLYDRLLFYGIRELLHVLSQFSRGDTTGEQQNNQNATYWPSRIPADGVINWGLPASKIVSIIRALAGRYPSAFTYYDGDKIEIDKAVVVNPNKNHSQRTVDILDRTKLVFHTGDNQAVELLRVGISDEPKLTGMEFAAEQGISSGDTVGTDADFPPDYVYTALRGPDPRKDLRPVTNGEVGSKIENSFYCHVPHGKRQLQMKLKIDGEVKSETSTTVRGRTSIPITFVPVSEQHYLEVESNLGDTRATYIYASENTDD